MIKVLLEKCNFFSLALPRSSLRASSSLLRSAPSRVFVAVLPSSSPSGERFASLLSFAISVPFII
jgi:hypothetical protein